jgi:hypothetical protein
MEQFRDIGGVPGGLTLEDAMESISTILGECGMEHIPEGSNRQSPEIYYVNTGDTYGTTVLFYNDSFHIGDWGYLVERGNYA